MSGTNSNTGKPLAGTPHLYQSVTDILTTPVGSRVMRRLYGSNIRRLIDAPINDSTIIGIIAAVADALEKWEPRLILERVAVDTRQAQSGLAMLDIFGQYVPENRAIVLRRIAI